MDSPQKSIMEELRRDEGKKFAIVVNDIALMRRNRQIYVRARRNAIEAVWYERVKGRRKPVEHIIPMDKCWEYLERRVMYGMDFSSYFNTPHLKYKVIMNRSFDLLFIESPIMTFVKECVKVTAGRSINSIMIPGTDTAFWEQFQRAWPRILGQFQVEAGLQYTALISKTLRRKINNKLYYAKNQIFKETLVDDKINFIPLFLRTAGLYNPFLEDKQLTQNAKESWFFGTNGNSRLFVRDGKQFNEADSKTYQLHCMTVLDFCRSIGLSIKLGFTAESALLLLFSLMYSGSHNSIDIPAEYMTGYMAVDRDVVSDKVMETNFYSDMPPKSHEIYDRHITTINGIDAYSLRYAGQLGEGEFHPNDLKKILLKAKLEARTI